MNCHFKQLLGAIAIGGLAVGLLTAGNGTGFSGARLSMPGVPDSVAKAGYADISGNARNVGPRHHGPSITSAKGLLVLRCDDGRRDIVDSLFYRASHSVSGRGPWPFLARLTLFCVRPEADSSSYYQGGVRSNWSMTLAELHAMEAAGCEIGGHTKGHIIGQAGLNDGTITPTIIGKQVGDNYRYLADTCGFNVTSFAFPNDGFLGCYRDTVAEYFEQGTFTSQAALGNWFRPVYDVYGASSAHYTYGAPIDRHAAPAYYWTTGQTIANARLWLRGVAEHKQLGIIMLHSPYSTWSSGGGGTWAKGGDNATTYFDNVLAVIDSLEDAGLLEVVTFAEAIERISSPYGGCNLICEPGDWDGNGVPNGLEYPATAFNDGTCTYSATGGWCNGPSITTTAVSANPIRWTVGPRVPVGTEMLFSCMVKHTGTALTLILSYLPNAYPNEHLSATADWRAAGSSYNVLVLTDAWQPFYMSFPAYPGVDQTHLYFGRAAGAGDGVIISNWSLRVVGGRTLHHEVGFRP